ncbi:MAG: hypothetical protein M1821_006915 [Bathelium mastoideum]|nr:MAG: hypothetical protein M1821_006915 [Bathelium mastoideum]KAI9687626.1 MAG: hypothetical protein M1822_002236 [Bathelium mastoideum]
MADVEADHKDIVVHDEKFLDSGSAPKLDPYGFPLCPQPTDDPLDPLNWSFSYKFFVLCQAAFLAFLGPFTQAVINSAFAPMSKAEHISLTTASYVTTVPILFAGISPILWSPLSNVYGRRPVFVAVGVIGIVSQCASGAAQGWAGILVTRAFMGLGTSAGMGIGAAVVADMYFMHERGKFMGIWVVFVTNGAHLATVVGGFTALNPHLGWRWCFWLPSIVWAANWLFNLLFLPETLYHRNNKTGVSHQQNTSFKKLFTFNGIPIQRRVKLWDFTHVFYMLKYPSVLLPTMYYALSFGVGSVLFAITAASAFGSIYHFNTAQVGMASGLSTFVGTLIGELAAGPVSDYILVLNTKRTGGEQRPEARLPAMWPGFLLCPTGAIIEGVCFQYKTHWAGPIMGICIGAFGLQIISTNTFAYITDCYKPQSAEISTLLNFGRQTFSFTLGFYMLPFAHRTTFGIAWAVLAIIQCLFFSGIIALMWRGKVWRERLEMPKFDRDI